MLKDSQFLNCFSSKEYFFIPPKKKRKNCNIGQIRFDSAAQWIHIRYIYVDDIFVVCTKDLSSHSSHQQRTKLVFSWCPILLLVLVGAGIIVGGASTYGLPLDLRWQGAGGINMGQGGSGMGENLGRKDMRKCKERNGGMDPGSTSMQQNLTSLFLPFQIPFSPLFCTNKKAIPFR